MKLSLCNETIREMPFDRQCRFAAAVGYDGLEIAPFTLSEEPHRMTRGEIAAAREALADAGIVCSSLHYLLLAPAGLSITAADPAVRARTLDVLKRLVELAAELGAAVLVHGSPAQRQLPDDEDESAARARGIDAFHEAGEAARAAGVVYCVEPLARTETGFVNTVAEAAAIVEAADNPALRTMIDCSAAARTEGDVAALVDRWLPTGLLAHVQANDANRRGPGEGEVRFAPILAALKRGGYAGWVAVEPFVYEPDGPACAARSAGYLRGVLEGLAEAS